MLTSVFESSEAAGRRVDCRAPESRLPLTPACFPAAAVVGLEALHLWRLSVGRPVRDAILLNSQLTSLQLLACWFSQWAGHWAGCRTLRALAGLQDLAASGQMDEEGQPVPPLPCLDLAGCSRLTALSLTECGLRELPPGLSTLSALQRCALSSNRLDRAYGWPGLTHLHQLSDLDLGACSLTTVPASLSRLTGLQQL